MHDPIVLDEEMFDEAYIPERLLCREGQIKEMAKCLKPAKDGKSIINLFIFGSPGVGKTMLCRWMLNEHFPKKSVYVNCWSKRTSHKVMEEILLQSGIIVHGQEPTSDLIKKFERSAKKTIVCLDEIDQLDEPDILYVLARKPCDMILISNDGFALSDLDYRIKSSLLLNDIEFKPYSDGEILQILKERVLRSFRPDSITDDLLSIVSRICNGDARIGLQTLRYAAKEAESKGLDRVTIEEIKSAMRYARKYRLSYLLRKLNEDQRIIYEILKKNGKIESGRLFEEYRKSVKEMVTDRSYRNYMKRMVELGLIKVEGSGRWKIFEIR